MTLTDEQVLGAQPEPALPPNAPATQPPHPDARPVDGNLLVPEGTRVVHIGPPKTGTTGLQLSLFMAAKDMEEQGVRFASRGRHAMSAVLAGIEQPDPWSDDRKPPPRWKWTTFLRGITSATAPRVIVSSEMFADASPEAIRRVVDEMGGDRVHIVVTLRPLSKLIPSQWQQWVQNLWVDSLDKTLRSMIEKPDGGTGTMFWRRHRHDQLIERWAAVVGRDRLTAIVLDETDHLMAYRSFEQLLGLRPGTLKVYPELSNRSLTLPEIEVIRAFNKAYRAEKMPRTIYTRVIRFGASGLMEARVPEAGEARIELPDWAVEPIARIARQIVDGIRESGVRVVGDLDSLAVSPARSTTRPAESATVTVSPEVAASAAMGVLVASGLARGTGRITLPPEEVTGELPRVRAARPVHEPPELLRISTRQLLIVLVRRARALAAYKVGGLLPWRKAR